MEKHLSSRQSVTSEVLLGSAEASPQQRHRQARAASAACAGEDGVGWRLGELALAAGRH
jgi:hypothetical protein